jgi:hypothetical protein
VLRPKRPESIDSLSYFGEDAVVSKNLWPARSPDLSTWYCFLCGALKQKACRNNSHTLADANNFITVGICGYRVVNFIDIKFFEDSACGSGIITQVQTDRQPASQPARQADRQGNAQKLLGYFCSTFRCGSNRNM